MCEIFFFQVINHGDAVGFFGKIKRKIIVDNYALHTAVYSRRTAWEASLHEVGS